MFPHHRAFERLDYGYAYVCASGFLYICVDVLCTATTIGDCMLMMLSVGIYFYFKKADAITLQTTAGCMVKHRLYPVTPVGAMPSNTSESIQQPAPQPKVSCPGLTMHFLYIFKFHHPFVSEQSLTVASHCMQDCGPLSWHAYAYTGVSSLSTPLDIHRLTPSIYEKVTPDCTASKFIIWSLRSVFPANDFSVNDICLFSLKYCPFL